MLRSIILEQIEKRELIHLGSQVVGGLKYSLYDIEPNPRRSAMFTVVEHEDGWYIQNSAIPEDYQGQGIGTDFYIRMNRESLQNTGNPLRSTPPVELRGGKTIRELHPLGEKLWDALVRNGYAEKLGDKHYIFKVN